MSVGAETGGSAGAVEGVSGVGSAGGASVGAVGSAGAGVLIAMGRDPDRRWCTESTLPVRRADARTSFGRAGGERGPTRRRS